MPKQKGLFITGTYNGICYYKMNGQYYCRRKSTLSRKRVKQSPAFKLTMKYAGLLGQASRVAAEVYRSLPRAQRKHALYREWTGQAMQLLKAGMEATMVVEQLKKQCAPAQQTTTGVTAPAAAATAVVTTATADTTTTAINPATAPAKLVIKRKTAPPPHLQTKYARIFVHPSGRISATGLMDAVADKRRRRLPASIEERE